ncbi:MAG: hypothetical protein V7765_14825 [Oleispira sp.]
MIDVFLACLLMGLGIGIDVALATFIRASSMKDIRTITLWLLGVTLTHTLFPMAGYLIAYFSISVLPFITPLVGIIAFLFIAYFVKEELQTMNDASSPSLMVNFALILAVSWDALWSGPAKSAQVVGWSEYWVWVSFLIVGLVVLIFASFSLWLAKRVRVDYIKLSWLPFELGPWLQLSVVSYFGLLALLRYTFQFEVVEWQVLFVSSVIIAMCLMRMKIPNIGSPKTKLPT